MKFRMIHENYNVADLDKSLAFYEAALGLTEKRRKTADDGSFIIVYIGNEDNDFEVELTWLRDHPQKYDIGEEEFHLAFRTSARMIMKRPINCTRRWDAYASRIQLWGSTLSRIRTGTGWRSFLKDKNNSSEIKNGQDFLSVFGCFCIILCERYFDDFCHLDQSMLDLCGYFFHHALAYLVVLLLLETVVE